MRPLNAQGLTRETLPDGSGTTAFVAQFIKPNRKLNCLERLQIYNQQYWLRLISCLEEDFPGMRMLLGVDRFQALATAYLQSHPSTSFSLNELGHKLPEFLLKEPYWGEPHSDLLLDIARFEWAQAFATDADKRLPLKPEDLAARDPAKLVLILQPHLQLLELNHPTDVFVRRAEAARVNHSEAIVCPSMNSFSIPEPVIPKRKKLYIAIFRHDNILCSKRLEPSAFYILQLLKEGTPLGEACATAILNKHNSKDQSKLQSQIASWFKTWNELEWFCRS